MRQCSMRLKLASLLRLTMSATNRALARLPADIFEDLITRLDDDADSGEDLRNAICAKLISVPRKTRNGGAVSRDSIKTVGALLQLSMPALLRALDPILTYEECEEFYRRTCIHCAPKPCNALSLLRSTEDISELDRNAALSRADRMRYLPTGISSLDRHLRGGVRVGTITELVGKAGVGKTQLAMQLCVMAARYGQGCVYIDTEQKLSLDRMREIASKRASTFNAVPPPLSNGDSLEGGFSYGGDGRSANDSQLGGGDERRSSAENGNFSPADLQYQSPHNVFQNVTVHSPASTDELLAVMATIEDEIFLRNQEAVEQTSSKFPVRLLVLDSIAAPARRDFGSGSAPQRAAIIFQIAQTLKRLADQLHLAIVVINQVGAMGNTNEDGEQGTNRAALGTSWHHCLSTRILMEYQNSLASDGAPVNRNSEVRQATIVKSNLTGQVCVPFEVSALGVSDVSP